MATKQYIEAVGRRKTAVARARITPGEKTSFVINDKDIKTFFPVPTHQGVALDPLLKLSLGTTFGVTVKVNGGGIASQADAVRHAISRALVAYDENLRTELKKLGFLRRDPRAKERRKFGLVKARKRKQWSKR